VLRAAFSHPIDVSQRSEARGSAQAYENNAAALLRFILPVGAHALSPLSDVKCRNFHLRYGPGSRSVSHSSRELASSSSGERRTIAWHAAPPVARSACAPSRCLGAFWPSHRYSSEATLRSASASAVRCPGVRTGLPPVVQPARGHYSLLQAARLNLD